MSREENEQFVKGVFEYNANNSKVFINQFTDDVDAAVEAATAEFEQMLPNLAYVDDPKHVMANSMFFCASMLAVYLALRKQGTDVHDFGAAFLETMAKEMRAHKVEVPAIEIPEQSYFDAAEASQKDAKEGEFVFEVFEGENDDVDWGMNVKSCGICAHFSKYDAMDLVPYMCASDDVVSDYASQGLRRTGTIALGAGHCDFLYKREGDALRVAEQYPDKIHVIED